jgi:hypothetical protein
VSSFPLPFLIECHALTGEVRAQLVARVMKCFIESASGRVEPLGKHVDRHVVQRRRDEDLALMWRQLVSDRLLNLPKNLTVLGA